MSYVLGENVVIKEGTIIGDDVVIEDNVYIDYNCIIRDNVTIKKGSSIGAHCIIGEVLADFYQTRQNYYHPLVIGENAIIRSGTILYGDTVIGTNFQTGHHVTIREKTKIGDNVSVGTLSDIQGNCQIGNYVRIHSNVHIGQLSQIDDFVWIFPYTVLTNDPTPPSEHFIGVQIKSFAIIATGSIIMPGIVVESDSLVAAGAIVTRNVLQYTVVGGNPAKVITDVRNIKNKKTGENIYPWRYTFKRSMPWEDSDYDHWYHNNIIHE